MSIALSNMGIEEFLRKAHKHLANLLDLSSQIEANFIRSTDWEFEYLIHDFPHWIKKRFIETISLAEMAGLPNIAQALNVLFNAREKSGAWIVEIPDNNGDAVCDSVSELIVATNQVINHVSNRCKTDENSIEQAKRGIGQKQGRRGGRNPANGEEQEADAELTRLWRVARKRGIKKESFCLGRGLSERDLNRALDRVRKRTSSKQ